MDIKKRNRIIIKICSILLLSGAFIYYFFFNNPSDKGTVFLRCPSNFIFGINCPGCGSQRAIHHLLHFDILEALRFNALLTIMFPFIIYITLIWLYNFIFEKKIRIKLFYNNKFVWTLFFLVIVYGVIRNINIYPFTLITPP
ncbi:DUF2752 domain-containing protein [Empedobacter tilapiae]|uniref:DUF2752 domain-containing protein n=1 Tax=Empedobacter tilapiae TaxID=2491114 RepID=A0A4Z1BK94_9FLAO|nr:DUF2752 domain-containing protein [Empedobacter tilapiae]